MSQYQIKINEPCHENWNAMTPKEQGRFCGVCTKDVIDFTRMTDEDVKSYFTNYNGSLCGRFNTQQLEKKDERYFSLSEYTKRFIRAFAVVFLMFTGMEASSQIMMGQPAVKGKVICTQDKKSSYKGVVFGPDGSGIADAEISVYQSGKLKLETVTDDNGLYLIHVKEGSYEVRITKEGYQSIVTNVELDNIGVVGDYELKKEEDLIEPQIMGMIEMGEPEIDHSKQ